MKKIILLSFILIILISSSKAQRFPLPIKSADTLRLHTLKGIYRIPNNNDTLWIFKNTQFQQALIKAKKLELTELEIIELNNKVSLLEKQANTKSELVTVVKKDRDFYKKNWETCEDDFDVLAKRIKRKSLYTKLAIAGIPVAFVTGFLMGK